MKKITLIVLAMVLCLSVMVMADPISNYNALQNANAGDGQYIGDRIVVPVRPAAATSSPLNGGAGNGQYNGDRIVVPDRPPISNYGEEKNGKAGDGLA